MLCDGPRLVGGVHHPPKDDDELMVEDTEGVSSETDVTMEV